MEEARDEMILGYTIEERDKLYKKYRDCHDGNHPFKSDSGDYGFFKGAEKFKENENIVKAFRSVNI